MEFLTRIFLLEYSQQIRSLEFFEKIDNSRTLLRIFLVLVNNYFQFLSIIIFSSFQEIFTQKIEWLQRGFELDSTTMALGPQYSYQIQLNSFADVQPGSFAGLRPVNVAQGSKAKLKRPKFELNYEANGTKLFE